MLKTIPQSAGTLLATSVDNSKIVGSSGKNDRKSAKSDIIKPMYRAEESSFLTPNARRALTQLRQVFTEAPIF